jgi:multiple sugar transport system substrate-binding protein
MNQGIRALFFLLLAVLVASCGGGQEGPVVTIAASRVGAEGEILRAQVERFMKEHPGVRVVVQETPDAADQRHQLFVQWLSAGSRDPDVLQLDVIWTPEFASAGWILPLDDRFTDRSDFLPATLAANTWEGRVWAVPWFVDVGILYRRTDLAPEAPATLEDLVALARRGMQEGVPYGFVWQGARYEGLVTVFLEILGGFGGQILDAQGRVVVDSPAAVRALRFLRDAVHTQGISPEAVLAWQEERVRFAFQNGQAVFMRNWPYAYTLLGDSARSQVAGRFAVSPMPAQPGGHPTAALGGSQLAINARTAHPDLAWALVAYLTDPERMAERARVVGQFPPRRSLYEGDRLRGALAIPPEQALRLVESAVPRPVTPRYTEVSQILQIWLHRALTLQAEPEEALAWAAEEMRRKLVPAER